MLRKRLLTFLLLLSLVKLTTGNELSEYTEIYLLTYMPGDELYSVFGHSALRIRDPLTGYDMVYNYGTFDFSTPFFYVKFVKGNLLYQLSKTEYVTALKQMKLENRAVLEQRLSLTMEEKLKLYHSLEHDYLPENRTYKYRFFKNNCSTKIRDLIEGVISSPIKYETTKQQLTFRELVHKYLDNRSWTKLGIDLMLGKNADNIAKSWETMFLPDYLTFHFALATVKRDKGIHSLATRPVKVIDNNQINRLNFFKPSLFFIFCLLSLLVLAPKFYPKKSNSAVLDLILFGATAFYGIILLYVTLATQHPELKHNYNLIWSLPALVPIFLHFTHIKIKSKILPAFFVAYGFSILAVMVGNNWFSQSFPIELYPFLIILIIHSGLKAVKLI